MFVWKLVKNYLLPCTLQPKSLFTCKSTVTHYATVNFHNYFYVPIRVATGDYLGDGSPSNLVLLHMLMNSLMFWSTLY